MSELGAEDSARVPMAPMGAHRRWLLPLALAVTTLVGFFDRLNLAIALPAIAHDFGWSTEEIGSHGGTLLSLFFVGYGLSNIFLSPVAERWGPRRSLLLVIFLFSCFAALGAPLSGSLATFGATRLLMGLGEGPHFPMMSTVTKTWFPVHERSRANGIWIAGALIATITAPFVVVPVSERFGWRGMLVGIAMLGMVVSLPAIWAFVYDKPADAPFLGEKERGYLDAHREVDPPGERGLTFLRRGTFWLAVGIGALNNFVVFGVISWLPTYFTKGREVAYEDLTFCVSIPYASGIVGVALFAWLGDKLGKRIVVAAIGLCGSAFMVWLAAHAPTIGLVILCFAGATLCQSSYQSQEFALIQRILPAASISKGSGVYNGLALLVGGGLGTAVVGGVVAATKNYNAGILTICPVALLAAIFLFILSRKLKY